MKLGRSAMREEWFHATFPQKWDCGAIAQLAFVVLLGVAGCGEDPDALASGADVSTVTVDTSSAQSDSAANSASAEISGSGDAVDSDDSFDGADGFDSGNSPGDAPVSGDGGATSTSDTPASDDLAGGDGTVAPDAATTLDASMLADIIALADTAAPGDTAAPSDTEAPADTAAPADVAAVDSGPAAACTSTKGCPVATNPCLTATCNGGVCGFGPTAQGTPCASGDNVCTGKQTCQSGVCTASAALNCDDGNACTTDSCHAAKGCQHVVNTLPCDADSSACTVGDTCKSGVCKTGAATVCDDNQPCTADSCDTATGKCAHKPLPTCPACAASFQDGRLVHGNAPPLVQVDPKCKRLSYGRYAARGESKAIHLLPDFSYAGYMGGGVAIPAVAVKKTLKPISGDNRAQIQAAIDAVSKLPLDAKGHRGAVLLSKGTYKVSDTLFIQASGVVLRGAGQGTTGTVLMATKQAQHDLVHIKGGGSGWKLLPGTSTTVASTLVPVGARTFTVVSGTSLKPGMTIAVHRTPNQAWIDVLGMGKYGWKPSGYGIRHERHVVAVSGNSVTVDIPLVDAIDAKLGGATVFGVDFSSRITQVGVEDLRLVSSYASATDEKHGWNAVKLTRAANSWVRRVTAQHFGMSAVTVHSESAFNTIEEVAQLDPKSVVTGGRRYSFNITDGVGILFQRCFARGGRHNFVTGSGVTGPNVWLDSLSVQNYNDEGPHHRWATGSLLDSCMSEVFNAQNRKTSGTGHGWAGAQVLFWNLLATSEIRCDAPQRAMNWAVGCVGTKAQGSWAPEEPFGLFESHGKPVGAIRSLYLMQLKDRLGAQAVGAVTLPQQSGRIWNALAGWAGKAALASTIQTVPAACKSGLFAGKACCAAACGVCGGTGCGARPGGSNACCTGSITSAKKACGKYSPPCLLP